MNLNKLKKYSADELNEKAIALGVRVVNAADRGQLILEILRSHADGGGTVSSVGTLEILGDGFGFLRGSKNDFSPSPQDVYVSPSQIRRFHLNTGDEVAGQVRPPKETERYFALLRVETINGAPADKATTSQGFSEREAIHSNEHLRLTSANTVSRLFDLLCPLGKGQRALLLAPPRTHGDELLLALANAAKQSRDYDLSCLVLGQRPEFVHEYQEAHLKELATSVFDEPAQRHTQISDVVVETAKRAADKGRNVLLLVDSLSRLASAASQSAPGSGVALPGGLSARGMQTVRRLFGAGRNLQGAGSITVIGLLRDSGSPLDTYLRQELIDVTNASIQLCPRAASAGCALPLARDGVCNPDEHRFLEGSSKQQTTEARASLEAAGDLVSYQKALGSLERE